MKMSEDANNTRRCPRPIKNKTRRIISMYECHYVFQYVAVRRYKVVMDCYAADRDRETFGKLT